MEVVGGRGQTANVA